MKTTIKTAAALALAAAGVAIAPQTASAAFEAGDVDLNLAAQGANGPDFDAFAASANAQIGYFATDALEVGIRQTVSYQDSAGSTLGGTTAVFVDYHFEVAENLFPYVGANIGYAYGDLFNDTFFAAPEAGVKYFVSDAAYIFGSAQYQFFFEDADDADDSFSDGQFLYTVGIGLVF